MKLIDEVHLLTEASLSRLKQESVLSNLQKQTQRFFFMKKQESLFQTKEQDKFPETDLNKTKINYLLNRVQNSSHKDGHQVYESNT